MVSESDKNVQCKSMKNALMFDTLIQYVYFSKYVADHTNTKLNIFNISSYFWQNDGVNVS